MTSTASGSDAPPSAAAARPALITGADGLTRCGWVGHDALYERYHDEEWGRPVRDDAGLLEKLCLEGFQSGLAWITILRKREAFRDVFHHFDIETVAAMTEDDVERLAGDARIIRNRSKIRAAIGNARVTRDLTTSLTDIIWSHAPDHRDRPRPRDFAELPAVTPESTALSARLRSLGYRFVGPTTVYALMQATGLVDDHFAGCWRVEQSPPTAPADSSRR